jgi:hypothetical protein
MSLRHDSLCHDSLCHVSPRQMNLSQATDALCPGAGAVDRLRLGMRDVKVSRDIDEAGVSALAVQCTVLHGGDSRGRLVR